MKISQYRREGRQLEIIVTSFTSDSPLCALLKDFREKYLSSLAKQDNVRIIPMTVLCEEQDVEYEELDAQSTLTRLLPRLAASPPLTLLLVDETKPGEGTYGPYESSLRQMGYREQRGEGEGEADWADFQPCDNLDFMIALAPWSYHTRGVYRVTPPADQQLVLSRRLLTPHRNCHQIRQLYLFFLHHYGRIHLSSAEDLAAPHLPPGRLPIWIQRTEEESDISVLEMVKEEYTGSLSVMVIDGHDAQNYNEETRGWCRRQGWRYVDEDIVPGTEDQCVVLLARSINTYIEGISRGKNLLVAVTTQGDG